MNKKMSNLNEKKNKFYHGGKKFFEEEEERKNPFMKRERKTFYKVK